MKNTITEFGVKCDDPILLKAFEEKLKELDFVHGHHSKDKSNKYLIKVCLKNKIYGYGHENQLDDDNIYYLPQEWDDAIKNLKKERYNVNDWVVSKEIINSSSTAKYAVKNPVKLLKRSYTYGINKPYWDTNYEGCIGLYENEIKRLATQEEIYNHLIKQTNIKIGDKIGNKLSKDGTCLGIVDNIILYSECEKIKLSNSCDRYYHTYGDYLVCEYGDHFSTPLPLVKKIDDNIISFETNKDTYQIEYDKKKNIYHIGCIENIDYYLLSGFETIMNFCKNNNIHLKINNIGEIDNIYFNHNNEYMVRSISIERIKNLLKRLK